MVYSPPAPVFAVRDSAVLALVTVTSALGTTAPAGSVTTPEIVPVNFCAANGKATHKLRTSTSHVNLRISYASARGITIYLITRPRNNDFLDNTKVLRTPTPGALFSVIRKQMSREKSIMYIGLASLQGMW